MTRCDHCGQFMAKVQAICIGPEKRIEKVIGDCKCGKGIETSDWVYEDFFYGGD